MRNLAIILIIGGILILVAPYIPFTKKDKVLDVGPIQAYKTEEKTVPIPPVVGAIILASGFVILVLGATRR